MRSRFAVLALAAGCAATLVAFAWPAPTIPGPRPTPKDWEQWQPQVEEIPGKLDHRVLVWEQCIRIGDLLGRLGEETGVQLAAVDEIAQMQVSIYAGDWALSTVMTGLATLVEGHWYYRRGEEPDSRSFCLAGDMPAVPVGDQWLRDERARRRHQQNLDLRPARAARMARYREAISLGAEEVLTRYESEDPWLCADVLDPAIRPIIRYALDLSDADQEHLLSEGLTDKRVAQLEPAFAEHLARWAKGEYGWGMGRREPDSDPDFVPRFSSPEQRWLHSTLRLQWHEHGLRCILMVADGGWFFEDCVTLPNDVPSSARLELVRLGYRKPTDEYLRAVDQEAKEWQERAAAPEHGSAPQQSEDAGEPESRGDDSPVLATSLDIAWPANSGIAGTRVFESIAQQCGLLVVADFVPPAEMTLFKEEEFPSRCTLRQLLSLARRQTEGALSWRFRGKALALSYAQARLAAAAALPEDLMSAFRRLLSGGKPVTLGDLADALAPLTALQLSTLEDQFPALSRYPLERVRFYGRLTHDERAGLLQPPGLSYGDLREELKQELFQFAREKRSWLELEAMAGTTLRAVERPLSVGGTGLTLVAEYHFPDAQEDRDILFTMPMAIGPLGASRAGRG